MADHLLQRQPGGVDDEIAAIEPGIGFLRIHHFHPVEKDACQLLLAYHELNAIVLRHRLRVAAKCCPKPAQLT